MPRLLEPGVLVGGVVDHQLGNHAQAALVRLGNELAGIVHGAVVRVHPTVGSDIVAVIPPRRGIERQ